MIVYRYLPDGRRFRGMEIGYNDRFWPDGITLGRAAELEFPKGIAGTRWWLEGNRYESARGDTTPLADFVATTMNTMVVQAAAVEPLPAIGERVAVTVDGAPAYAFQLPVLEDIVDLERSEAVSGPEGEPPFWNVLALHPERISAEVFWVKEAMPFSYDRSRRKPSKRSSACSAYENNSPKKKGTANGFSFSRGRCEKGCWGRHPRRNTGVRDDSS